MALLLDTGILYAGYDRSDSWHEAAKSLLAENPRGLIVPAPVIPEVDYLLGKRLGSQARTAFYQGLADGHYFVAELPAEGYATVAELNRQFADLELGFVDAAVVVGAVVAAVVVGVVVAAVVGIVAVETAVVPGDPQAARSATIAASKPVPVRTCAAWPVEQTSVMARTPSRWSLWSDGSFLSIGSKNSVLSIGSVGSCLSIGSIGT
ncbi:MAG TPA: hypothetical protein PK413_05240, partial [Thermoanaerobaculia bacterium]|nr:hypothetical protein [Thermoanaerobaculia bacterium]